MEKLVIHPSISLVRVMTAINSAKYNQPGFCAACGEITEDVGYGNAGEDADDRTLCDHCGADEVYDAESMADLLRLRNRP